MKRRWRKDGGDYMTGNQLLNRTTRSGYNAPGALLMWTHNGQYTVDAWTATKAVAYGVSRQLADAKRLAETWLDKHATARRARRAKVRGA